MPLKESPYLAFIELTRRSRTPGMRSTKTGFWRFALGADRRLRQCRGDERLLQLVAGRRIARRELDPQLFTRSSLGSHISGLPSLLVDRRVDRGDDLGLEQQVCTRLRTK
jgi:hypothetical protein